MNRELFDDLVESIKDASAYLRGKKAAPVHFVDEPDPKEVRERLGLTQKA
jgi:hypothetical protein